MIAASKDTTNSGHWLIIVFFKLSFAGLILYTVLSQIDGSLLKKWLYSIDPLKLALALLAMQLSVYASALRSRYYLGQHQLRVSSGFSVRLYYVGMLFNIVLPGGIGGDAYKVYVLWKSLHFPKLQGIRIMFYERVNGVAVLGAIVAMLLPFSSFWTLLQQYLQIPIVLYALLAALVWPAYLVIGKRLLRDQTEDMIGASVYSVAGQLLQVGMATLLIYGLAPQINLLQLYNYLFLFALSSVVAIIPISIGGAGLRELTFLIGLDLINVGNQELGVAFAVLLFAIQIVSSLCGLMFVYKLRGMSAGSQAL